MDNQIARKIREAEESGCFLITITTGKTTTSKKGATFQHKLNLKHWYKTSNFPRIDLEKTMNAVKELVIENENKQLSSGSYKK